MSPVAAQTDRRFRRAHVKPARRRAAGAALVRPLLTYGAARRGRSRYGVYRTSRRRRAGARAAGRSHRRPRQRAAVGRRGAGGARAGCAARAWCGPTSTRGAGACWRRRGCATRRCGARCRRRSKSWCRSGSRSGIGRDQRRAVPGRRARRDHRRVRPAVRRSRSADHRRPVGVAGDGRIDDRRGARGAGGAAHRGAAGRSRRSRAGCRRSTSATCTTRR